MKETEIEELKVLNIAQPNAHNVMFNGKNVENRNMPTNFRGTIAIYASKTFSKERFENQPIKKDECSFGCIIGFADVVDCITEVEVNNKTKEWFSGPYGYVFENVKILKVPVEVSPPQGAVIWSPLSGILLKKCLEQLPAHSKIIPISIAEKKEGIEKPRTASSNRLIPSKVLAEIIGSSPISYKQSINKFILYLEENAVTEERDGESVIVANDLLKKIFKKKFIPLQEAVDFIKDNLN